MEPKLDLPYFLISDRFLRQASKIPLTVFAVGDFVGVISLDADVKKADNAGKSLILSR